MGLTLRDIHLPAEPAWWPPAPGWWLLALLGFIALFWLGRRLQVVLTRRRWVRAMHAAFQQMVVQAHAGTTADAVAAVSEFLRRAVRTRHPQAVALSGDAWIDYLNTHGGNVFTPETAALLREGAYRADLKGDVAPLLKASADWLVCWLRGVRRA